MPEQIHIYTDGACRGNPGPGGWAAIVQRNGQETELAGREEDTTNNRMEILAAIKGLEATPEDSDVSVHTASQYLVNTMTKGWKRNANSDLWQVLDKLVASRSVTWEVEPKNSAQLPRANGDSVTQIRAPANGVARYQIPNTTLRQQIYDRLAASYALDLLEVRTSDWAVRISTGIDRVTVTMFATGILIVQGRATELLDAICSSIEGLCSPQIKEIASRFVSESEDEVEKFQIHFSPALITKADDSAKESLGSAFAFLDIHDQRYAVSAFCLLLADLTLPEYSPVVMPLSKSFEGYLKKLFVFLGLATAEEFHTPEFTVGKVFDDNSREKTKRFLKKGSLSKGMLNHLKGELAFSRHFLMHSQDSQATQVQSINDAQKYIIRLSDSIKRSYEALVLGL